MAILQLDDRTKRVEVTVYAEILQTTWDLLVNDRLLIIEGQCRDDEFTGGYSVVADKIYSLDTAREKFARRLIIHIPVGKGNRDLVSVLKEILDPHRPGRCPVNIEYEREDAIARLSLGEKWRIRLSDPIVDGLKERFGRDQIRIEY